MKLLSSLVIGVVFATTLETFAQVAGSNETPAAAESAYATAPIEEPAGMGENAVQSLEALQRALDSKETEIEAVQQQLQGAQDDVSRAEYLAKLASLKADADDLRRQFEKFAVDVDITPFVTVKEKKAFDWQEEVGKLLRPIMAEVENATAESRAIGELRARLNEVTEKQRLAETAVSNLEALLAQSASPELKARLEDRHTKWKRLRDEARNEATALDLQLKKRMVGRKSMLQASTDFAKTFFKTRGLNLTLGILAFCAIFFAVRGVGYLIRKSRATGAAGNFGSRLAALMVQVFSVLGGLLAMMLVFNMVGDWFLLGIIVIFLLGVGWASINTLPQHVETVRLMLNIGAVREGERLIFNDTPYKVAALGFAARLVNPLLDGGLQVVPVKDLVGMHSRPPGEHEDWFPCRPGDWVELSDGRIGRVACQSPSSVRIVELGGAQTTYQTPAFLALSPRNLSANFRVRSTFGVDYQHQSIATTEIPRTMEEELKAGLASVVEPGHILDVSVLFANAGASSLDYVVTVDIKGDAAERHLAVTCAIPRLLVDTCTKHGWNIPFTQLTVHQAT